MLGIVLILLASATHGASAKSASFSPGFTGAHAAKLFPHRRGARNGRFQYGAQDIRSSVGGLPIPDAVHQSKGTHTVSIAARLSGPFIINAFGGVYEFEIPYTLEVK